MEENKISELMDVTMTKLRQLADTNTIVGSPITTPDGITVFPYPDQLWFRHGRRLGRRGKGREIYRAATAQE